MAKAAIPGFHGMDLRAQAGQLLIMGVEGLAMDAKLRATLKTLRPGGAALFARNIESPRQTWALLRDCRRSSPFPMFLSVDMEGGTVDRLRKAIAPAPSAERVFSSGDPKLFRMHGQIIGQEIRALGFNTDFAPVMDLGLEASRPVLASRTVSADPAEVARYAREFLRGLKAARIVGCGKHFPGLGGANLDSHKALPTIQKPWKKLWAEDLVPYRELYRRLPLIMVAHAYYPEVTRDKLPASLSRKWMEILRGKIGYRGLIISDDLEMGGALAAGSMEEIAVETLRAGADMFLVCNNQELVWRAYEAVVREAEKDRRFAAHIHAAARRTLRFKQRSFPPQDFAEPPTAKAVATLKKTMLEFSTAIEERSA